MKKRLMAAVLSTAMAATMLLTGSISVQAADAAAANDPAVELIFTSVSVTQIPSYSMFASGYLFSSYEHMTSVLNGDIGLNKIRPQIEETLNIKPLSSFYLGSRVINTREKEINSYDDMNGLLLRMPNSEA